MVAVACSCSSPAGSTSGEANHAARASSAAPAASAGAPDFTVVNFAGTNHYAIYVSPHDSAGWEENLLGRDPLFDGDIVKIRFSPEEKAARWDLRIEDVDGNNAEWKNLDLRSISKITLRLVDEVVIAEAE
jgi:hypothetical protein